MLSAEEKGNQNSTTPLENKPKDLRGIYDGDKEQDLTCKEGEKLHGGR